MHEINNLEAMAVTVQDYPTTTESIAPFLKLYERTKADATFWADQAATLNEKTRKSRRKFPRSDWKDEACIVGCPNLAADEAK